MSMKCETCQMRLNSAVQYQKHLSGRTHIRKLERALELKEAEKKRQQQKQASGKGQSLKGGFGKGKGDIGVPGTSAPQEAAGGSLDFASQSSVQLFGQGQLNNTGMQQFGQGQLNTGMQKFGQGQLNNTGMQQFGQGQLNNTGMQQFGQGQPSNIGMLAGLQMSGQLNRQMMAGCGVISNNMGCGIGGLQNRPGENQMFRSSQSPANCPPLLSNNTQSFGNNPFDNGRFGDSQFRNNQFGNNQFENSQFGNNQFGNNRIGNNQFGNMRFGDNQFGNNEFRNSWFGNTRFGNDRFGQNPNENEGSGFWRAPSPPIEEPSSSLRREQMEDGKDSVVVVGDSEGIASVSLEATNLHCRICCVSLTSERQAQLHYRGIKHIKRARVARLHEVGAVIDGRGVDNDCGEFHCDMCNIAVNSEEQMKIHMEGSKHLKMLAVRNKRALEDMGMEPSAKRRSRNHHYRNSSWNDNRY